MHRKRLSHHWLVYVCIRVRVFMCMNVFAIFVKHLSFLKINKLQSAIELQQRPAAAPKIPPKPKQSVSLLMMRTDGRGQLSSSLVRKIILIYFYFIFFKKIKANGHLNQTKKQTNKHNRKQHNKNKRKALSMLSLALV